MESLTIFLKLMDRLLSLVRERKGDKRMLFTEVATPIFKDLEAVIDDYFLLFRNAHRAIQDTPGTEWQSKVEEIKAQREQMWAARKKVVAFAEVVGDEITDQRYVDFARKICRLFHATDYHQRRNMSRSLEVVELLEAIENSNMSKHYVLERFSQTEVQLKEAWVAISQSYADLRLYSLK